MAQRSSEISDKSRSFIEAQKMFFVATAAVEGTINLSPKGMDSLRVLDKKRVVWLNLPGSGNETAAHVQEDPRMTLMFNAFEGPPMILRLYGKARAIHRNDAEWEELYALFDPLPGARQIFDLDVELVQTSCGASVPLYEYVDQRDQLNNWAIKKGDAGVKAYWEEKNQVSLDGKRTNIMEKGS